MNEQLVVAVGGTTVVARADISNCRLEFDMGGETYQLHKQPGHSGEGMYEDKYRLSLCANHQRALVAVIYKDESRFVATDTVHSAKGMTPLQAASALITLLQEYTDQRFYRYI